MFPQAKNRVVHSYYPDMWGFGRHTYQISCVLGLDMPSTPS